MYSYNFIFLKDLNLSYYEQVCDIEKAARIDSKSAANSSRILLEDFLSELEKGEENKRYKQEAIERLKDGEKFNPRHLASRLQILEWIRSNRGRNEKSLPKIKVNFRNRNIQFFPDKASLGGEYNGYDFLRMLGNAGSHAGKQKLKANTDNVIMALEIFHKVFIKYYSCDQDNNSFDRNNVPIGEYFITSEYLPIDMAWSKCSKEYGCHWFKGNRDLTKFYAVLREYKEEDYAGDNLFVTRNVDIYGNIQSSETARTVNVKELTCKSDDGNGSYFIAYEFTNRPYRLNNETFKQFDFSIKDRMGICAKIINSHSLFLIIFLILLITFIVHIGNNNQNENDEDIGISTSSKFILSHHFTSFLSCFHETICTLYHGSLAILLAVSNT